MTEPETWVQNSSKVVISKRAGLNQLPRPDQATDSEIHEKARVDPDQDYLQKQDWASDLRQSRPEAVNSKGTGVDPDQGHLQKQD